VRANGWLVGLPEGVDHSVVHTRTGFWISDIEKDISHFLETSVTGRHANPEMMHWTSATRVKDTLHGTGKSVLAVHDLGTVPSGDFILLIFRNDDPEHGFSSEEGKICLWAQQRKRPRSSHDRLNTELPILQMKICTMVIICKVGSCGVFVGI
jgi:hypothetical protein